MDRDSLVEQLAEVGLTRNQGLAWLTLLQDDGEQGLTGYEVGSRSGVPRSAIYKVMQQLEERGAAFSVGSDPQRFHAAAPDRWIERERQTRLDRLATLEEALAHLPRPNRPEPIWIVRSYDEVLDRIRTMLRGARESVYVHLWAREVERLWPELEALADSDLHTVLHAPGALLRLPRGFSCWVDTLDDDEARATWSHKAIVVVDRREALIGGAEPGADNDAVWTQNASLVDVATNHIILDITLLAARQGADPLADVAPMMRPHLDPR